MPTASPMTIGARTLRWRGKVVGLEKGAVFTLGVLLGWGERNYDWSDSAWWATRHRVGKEMRQTAQRGCVGGRRVGGGG